MKILNPDRNPSNFFDRLKRSQSRALLLDYDGTLAPFKVNRDTAFPYPGVTDILEQIIQNTRLVMISGRRVADLIPLLGLEEVPEIWGCHGGERLLPQGTYQKAALPRQGVRGLEAVAQWMEAMGFNEHLERKPFSLALHWRGMKSEEIKKMRGRILGHLPHLVEEADLTLHEFDGGLEWRPPEITKGEAVEKILSEMQSDTVSAYLGDDFTDEDAFAALKGRGLAVLVRRQLRKTRADLWLRPPEELLDFLRHWEVATS